MNELHRFPTIAAQGRLIRQMITQSQAMSNISEVQKTSESPTEVPPEVPSDIIALLRSSPPTATTDKQVLDIYCIHAIGGTFYPYYPILQIFPDWCRLYGVRYAPTLPCTSLLELAKVYASCVSGFLRRSACLFHYKFVYLLYFSGSIKPSTCKLNNLNKYYIIFAPVKGNFQSSFWFPLSNFLEGFMTTCESYPF